MRLITNLELATRSDGELHSLFRQVSEAVIRSEPESAGRANALASLENIAREISKRGIPKP